MARLIDEDELIKTLESFMDIPNPGYAMGIGRAIWLVKDAPTLAPSNEPLAPEELREMVGNPVYDCLGQVWYIVESYYDHDLIMTDGTHFNDENKYARVSKRFYCRPTIPATQWISVKDRLPEEQKEVLIYLPEYDSVEMASLFTIPSMNLREWVQNEDAYMLDEVSYWMPLPTNPKDGGE